MKYLDDCISIVSCEGAPVGFADFPNKCGILTMGHKKPLRNILKGIFLNNLFKEDK